MNEKPSENIGNPVLELHSNYYDVGEFHRKFGLESYFMSGREPHLIEDPSLQAFRNKFMDEELAEYKEAVVAGDLPKAADALIDLVYVVLGTAHLHHLPWQALFNEVQRANMQKERCEISHPYDEGMGQGACCGAPKHKHSLRGNINDVIKPPGWKPPNIAAVLRQCGWKCDGNHAGEACGTDCWNDVPAASGQEQPCQTCNATGRINALTGDLDCPDCHGTGQELIV